MQELKLKVSGYDVFKIVAVVLGSLIGLFFLYFIKDLLVILFVSFIFAAALNPTVNYLQEKRKFPRALSVLLVYFTVLLLLVILLVSFVPTILRQFNELSQNIPSYFQQVSGLAQPEAGLKENLQSFLNYLNTLFGKTDAGIFSTLIKLFGGLGSFVFILVITFYLIIDKEGIKNLIHTFLPLKYRNYILPFFGQAQEKIGLWLKGQIILCFAIGLLAYIGLRIIGVNSPEVLALFAGITEIIPFLGPWLGGIPAVLIALIQSPFKALLVAILYILIQQLEHALIVPRVMSKTVGLNPIVLLCSIWIGGALGGILGVIISIPAVSALSILLKDFWEFKKEKINPSQ